MSVAVRQCALVVDSGAALVDAPGTVVVPLRIEIDGEVLRDGEDIRPEDLYARLAAGATPRTSTPSPGEYLEAFRAAPGERILCLTMARRLSAMHAAATLAARLLAEEGDERPVEVLDTGSAAAGLALVARAAAALVTAGASFTEVSDRVRSARAEVSMLGTLRTLAHLARSGRVPTLAAGIGDRLGLRPVFELRDGEARRLALVRGRHRVLAAMRRAALTRWGADTPLWVLVVHSDAAEEAAELRNALDAVLTVQRSEVQELSPVVGSYTGAGMTGFAAMPLRGRELEVVP